MTSYLIGITGGSGSGKTYFLDRLVQAVGHENVTVISQDNYYRSMDEQTIDENGVENFDLPESIDDKKFSDAVAHLRTGKEVRVKEYTFNNPDVVPKELVFKPNPIVIVEGIFVLHYPEVASQIDLKLFVDAKDHIKIKRRILRDKVERGYDLNDVLYRYENHVMPSYEKYIDIHKRDADLIICNDKGFDRALDVLVNFLKTKIN
ncbi:MAG: uridine kinase [Thalassobius sp.]|nr:uridine kinase [Thalassovita sp.]